MFALVLTAVLAEDMEMKKEVELKAPFFYHALPYYHHYHHGFYHHHHHPYHFGYALHAGGCVNYLGVSVPCR